LTVDVAAADEIMRLLCFVLAALLSATAVATATAAAAAAAAATATTDGEGVYDAVTKFVLTCDAAAFANGEHRAPVHHGGERVNGDGHVQPYADVLYASFTTHGREFRFTLALNRNLFAANLHHSFAAGDGGGGGGVTRRRARAYARRAWRRRRAARYCRCRQRAIHRWVGEWSGCERKSFALPTPVHCD
jgi:hypothetical protein